jgi:guanylate kinase
MAGNRPAGHTGGMLINPLARPPVTNGPASGVTSTPAPARTRFPFPASAAAMVYPPKEIQGLLILVTGPTGSSKTALCRRFAAAHPEIERVVTCTTRAPRAGEQDGVDYFFLSDAQFDEALAKDEFLEWTQVHGARYGTKKNTLCPKLARNVDLVINVDVRGARIYRQAFEGDAGMRCRLLRVFVTPPDIEALQEHLLARGENTTEVIAQRLKTFRQEMEQWTQQDYCIVTGTNEEDLARLEGIWRAERCRVIRLRHVATLASVWMRGESTIPFEAMPMANGRAPDLSQFRPMADSRPTRDRAHAQSA